MYHSQLSYKISLKAALRGGLFASLLNLVWLKTSTYFFQITQLPKGFEVAVVFSSILPILLGSLFYTWCMKSFKKGITVFLILSIAFVFFSIFPAFENTLPDGNPVPRGFVWVTLPMHIFGGWFGIYYLYKSTRNYLSVD